MNRKAFPAFFLVFFILASPSLIAQEVLRGQIILELEPIYGFVVDAQYPLDYTEASRRAQEEAAWLFSSRIYGWSFHYDIGERARGIAEEYNLEPEGEILSGDPALKMTDAKFTGNQFEAWLDYHPGDIQLRRIRAWKQGQNRTVQSTGFCELDSGGLEPPDTAETWFAIRKNALEDAARSAVRQILRGGERNRPKEAQGFISLEAFPRYFMSSGQLNCSARFLVNITEITPFAAF